jgi:hypothetical protein
MTNNNLNMNRKGETMVVSKEKGRVSECRCEERKDNERDREEKYEEQKAFFRIEKVG